MKKADGIGIFCQMVPPGRKLMEFSAIFRNNMKSGNLRDVLLLIVKDTSLLISATFRLWLYFECILIPRI
jgi:hypothetical protein